MKKRQPVPQPNWLETQAEVIACRYEFGAGRALAFGLPGKNHFLITFTYYAHGKTYTADFTSPTYLEQGKTFSVTYNPLAPQQNSKSASASLTRTPLFLIGIAGSILLSPLAHPAARLPLGSSRTTHTHLPPLRTSYHLGSS